LPLFATRGRPDLQVEFTRDRDVLRAAVHRLAPRPQPDSTAEAAFNARLSLEALAEACRQLAAVRHRRKAVVLITQGAFTPGASSETGAQGVLDALRTLLEEARRSNVVVCSIDPAGLAVDVGSG
jgi:hypothetical protein